MDMEGERMKQSVSKEDRDDMLARLHINIEEARSALKGMVDAKIKASSSLFAEIQEAENACFDAVRRMSECETYINEAKLSGETIMAACEDAIVAWRHASKELRSLTRSESASFR